MVFPMQSGFTVRDAVCLGRKGVWIAWGHEVNRKLMPFIAKNSIANDLSKSRVDNLLCLKRKATVMSLENLCNDNLEET